MILYFLMGDSLNPGKSSISAGSLRQIFSSLSSSDMRDPLSIFAAEVDKKQLQKNQKSKEATLTQSTSIGNDVYSMFFGDGPTQTLGNKTNDWMLVQAPSNESDETWKVFSHPDNGNDSGQQMLTGEESLLKLKDVSVFNCFQNGRGVLVTLHLTNYRLLLIPSKTQQINMTIMCPSIHSWLEIPLMCIEKIEKEKKPKDTKGNYRGFSNYVTLLLSCKDVRHHRISIISNTCILGSNTKSSHTVDDIAERLIYLLVKYTYTNTIRNVFAFSHILLSLDSKIHPFPQPVAAVQYVPMIEYERQGLLVSHNLNYEVRLPWRISTANSDYRLCSSYPQVQ